MRNLGLKVLLTTFLFCLSSASEVLAATVTAVRGQKAVINLEGDPVSEGDEFFLIHPTNRKRSAIIRIIQIKGSRALADIVKGRGAAGYTLQAKALSPAAPMSADVPSDTFSPKEPSLGDMNYQRTLKDSFGLAISYNSNTMNAEISYKDDFGISKRTSASMSGTGLGLGGFYDYAFADQFVGRAYGAYEQFSVTGTGSDNACGGSNTCNADINYLSLYGLVKWYPLTGKYRAWIGGGMGFLMAASKSSSALNESQISTNQVYTLGAGVDIQLNRKNYIPLSFEMNQFPSSSSVNASMMVLKAGWAWNL